MDIIRFPVGVFQSNCYFLIHEDHCVIIDPGDSADFLLEELSRRKLTLDAIIATHGHFDHIMAVGEIQSSYPIPFYIHQSDRFLVDRLSATVRHFLPTADPLLPIVSISELKEGGIRVGDFDGLHILHTPGHTPGSCCIMMPSKQIICTGDTIFKEGIGRYDYSYSDKQVLKESLSRLNNLGEVYTMCPGHGEESLLHVETEYALTLF